MARYNLFIYIYIQIYNIYIYIDYAFFWGGGGGRARVRGDGFRASGFRGGEVQGWASGERHELRTSSIRPSALTP